MKVRPYLSILYSVLKVQDARVCYWGPPGGFGPPLVSFSKPRGVHAFHTAKEYSAHDIVRTASDAVFFYFSVLQSV